MKFLRRLFKRPFGWLGPMFNQVAQNLSGIAIIPPRDEPYFMWPGTFTRATLPAAVDHPTQMAYITDGLFGATYLQSDGASWIERSGARWSFGSGAPDSGSGLMGDCYFDAAACDLYEKTGASTWTSRGNCKGATGAAGSTGATGSTGSAGATGATGSAGSTGAAGAAGTNGTNGTNGANATTTSNATGTVAGLESATDKAKLDLIQALRSTTASDGTLTWAFPNPYPVGTLPAINVTPEDNTANVSISHKITTLSRTAVSIKLDRTTATVVGLLSLTISVISAPAAVAVHLQAQPQP